MQPLHYRFSFIRHYKAATIADQLLARFEAFHAQGYIRRDIKPENFLMGTRRQGNVVYMTDLGLAILKTFVESPTHIQDHSQLSHRQPRLLGTCRYASINGHYERGKFPKFT